MTGFRFRNLMVNLGHGQNLARGAGFGGFDAGCGDFPNTCHVITCVFGSRFCGIPSCNFSAPVGCRFSLLDDRETIDPISLAQLKTDLRDALREIEELEQKQDPQQVQSALSEIDDAAKRLQAWRDEIASRGKKG